MRRIDDVMSYNSLTTVGLLGYVHNTVLSSLSNNFWPFKIQTFSVFKPPLFSDHFLAYGFIWMSDRSSRPLLAIDEGQEKDRKLSDKFIEKKLFFFFSFAWTFILCQCRLTFWLKQLWRLSQLNGFLCSSTLFCKMNWQISYSNGSSQIFLWHK